MAQITWHESTRSVDSLEALDRLLDELHVEASRSEAVLVIVELPGRGDSLTIGLGRDISVLNFVAGSGNPPYFTSSGGPDRDEAVCFRFMGDLSEYPLRQTIPLEAARKALRHFWATGNLSPEIEWEET